MIDTSKSVSYYVLELEKSTFGYATVRQVMDMTTGLKYSEDYAYPNAEVWGFSNAGNTFPKPKDYKGPVGYYEYLETVKKEGSHGDAFGYKTVNTDVLGWIILMMTGKSVYEILSDRLWSKICMEEQDAYYQVDALGIPFAGVVLSAGLRDLDCFVQLILNMVNWNGEQTIPMATVLDIMKGGSKNDFAKSGYTKLKGFSYRNMWWITGNDNGAFYARGVHGQVIYIDPTSEMVIVILASHPVVTNGGNDGTSLPPYQAVLDYFLNKK